MMPNVYDSQIIMKKPSITFIKVNTNIKIFGVISRFELDTEDAMERVII
jgi:hypothetical protein